MKLKSGISISKLARLFAACCLFALAFFPKAASACAVCYGKSDSELAKGFNWGVMSLLVVVLFVLGGFVAFFVFLARRSALMEQTTVAPLANTTQQI